MNREEAIEEIVTDIVGNISDYEAENLVNKIYDDFDNQIEELNLQRITEIGDAQDAGYKVTDAMQKKIDDIESRTCENCKYFYTRNKVQRCRHSNVNIFEMWIDCPEDFGCNKWEAKT